MMTPDDPEKYFTDILLEKEKRRKPRSSLKRNKLKLEVRINLPLFSTVVPAIILMFLSCRPFVAITTLSTGLVSVQVTPVSWLGQLTV